MDGLRKRARQVFITQQAFLQPPQFYTVVQIVESKDGVLMVQQQEILEDNLIYQLHHPISRDSNDQNVCCRLQIVKICRDKTGSLQSSKDLFLSIYDTFGFDPLAMQMIYRESYGFQQLNAERSSDEELSALDTYYLKTISNLIIWSYDRKYDCTRAMFIPRVSDSVLDGNGIFASFVGMLDLQKDLVHLGSAWVLRLIALIELSRWIDQILDQVLELLRSAESHTGHGCWEAWEFSERAGNTVQRAPLETKRWNNVSAISMGLGFSVSTLANVERHIKIASELGAFEELLDEAAAVLASGSVNQHAATALAEVKTALSFHLRQVFLRTADVAYMQERAKSQLSVIFNLVNQTHTVANLSIAASAKKDSSSMKAIAMIAFLFLPGTFFATLFAIPSLHWSEDVVVSPRFWIYWAFTVPCTLLLFGLYLGWNLVSSIFIRVWELMISHLKA
ncbi:hypothetical protein V8F06_013893 [Rhypophila decipiens]